MLDLLIAAALAEAAATKVASAGSPDDATVMEIRVEAPRRTKRWDLPALDYRAAQRCTSWWVGDLPGFGTVSFGPACPDGDSDASTQ